MSNVIDLIVYNTDGNVYNIRIDSQGTVHDLKQLIQIKYNVPSEKMNLILRNKSLKNSDHLKMFDFSFGPGLILDTGRANEMTEHESDPSLCQDALDRISTSVCGSWIKETLTNKINYRFSFGRSYQIGLHFPDFKYAKYTVNESSTVNDILNMVKADPKKFCIYMPHVKLYDNFQIKQLGITAHTTIHCLPKKHSLRKSGRLNTVQLFLQIRGSNPEVIIIHQPENLDLAEIRKIVSANHKVPENELYVHYNGMALKDGVKLSEINIKNNEFIDVVKIEMAFFIQINTKISRFDLCANLDEGIIDVMNQITSKTGIPIKSQILFKDDHPIDVNQSISNVSSEKIFSMDLRTLNDPFYLVDFKLNQQKIKFDVDINESVLSLKTRICSYSPTSILAVGDQVLKYQNTILLDPALVLEYGIKYGETIEVIQEKLKKIKSNKCFLVNISFLGKFHRLDANDDYYIRDMRRSLCNILKYNEKKIELSLSPKKLKKNCKPLAMPHGKKIDLIMCSTENTIALIIKSSLADSFKLRVGLSLSIIKFKALLALFFGTIKEHIKVFYQGAMMEDDKILSSFNIPDLGIVYALFS